MTDDGSGADDGSGFDDVVDDEDVAGNGTTSDDEIGADVGSVDDPSSAVRGELVAFVRGLRAAGVDAPADAAVVAAEVLAAVGLADRERARAGLRAALVSRPDDVDAYDRLFPRFWRRLQTLLEGADTIDDLGAETPRADASLAVPTDDGRADRDDEATADDPAGADRGAPRGATDAASTDRDGERPPSTAQYSRVGRSEAVDPTGAVATPNDDAVTASVRRLGRALGTLPGRRWRPSVGGRRIDARRALRRSHDTGGVVLPVPRAERRTTATRALVLVDVSRSVLDVVDRDALVACLRAMTTEWRSVRTFFFDTDVREVTPALEATTTAAAYDALQRAEAEWGGGTRIGHALTTIRERHPDAVDRNAVAIVISDGLEMGEVEALADGAAWLSRRATRCVWLNPLAASSDYEPTARGMAAATPYVDGLFAFAGPDDLDEIADQLERYDDSRRLGYEFDGRRRSEID